MCAVLYSPLMFIQLAFFMVFNTLLIPIAFLVGLKKLLAARQWGRTIGFLIVGPFILLLAQITDLFYCIGALYIP